MVILYAVAVVVDGLKALLDWRPRFVLRHQFEKIFGFAPSKRGRIRKLEQQAVSERLAKLALAFDLLCQDEENLYASANRYGEDHSPLAVRRSVLALRPNLEVARQKFWRASNLARRFGFKVEEHIHGHMKSVEAHHRLAIV